MSQPDDTISVLLPVHAGVAPAHFEAAVKSLLDQTRAPDQVVVVEDGPLPSSHHHQVERLRDRYVDFKVITLPVNRGAGVANQAGLAAASGTWIAKMDADDICVPTRFERQLAAVKTGALDLCGSAMAEFESDPEEILGIRSNPLTHEAIVRRMTINNPINHPTAFYRRDRAIQAGGYPSMRYMQDYDLFARMLMAGARMCNLAEVLVLFRSDGGAIRRRRITKPMQSCEWTLQRNLRSYGFTGLFGMLRNLVLRSAFRALPTPWRLGAYRLLFRRAPSVEVAAGDGRASRDR